ncbi:MAG: dihydrolipoyl dehydrogenase [Acidimicrobiales bacterium]
MTEHFDLVVIGGGPAGYAAALYAGGAGLTVGLVERDRIGGTCLHRGCIPAKELLETAAVHRTVSEAAEFGVITSAPTLDFSVTQARKQRIIDGLTAGVEGLLKRRKAKVFNGTGSLGANRQVTVTSPDGDVSTISGDAVLLAAGSVPRTIPGFEVGGRIMTSDELLEMPAIPASAVVIGGGAIGCEFASMMSDLGSKVTILEAAKQIVPGVDTDIGKALARSFNKRGIDVLTGVQVTGHSAHATGTTVHIEGAEDLDVEAVVVSIGRRPFADHLGLEGAGVAVDQRGFVEVNDLCQTNTEGVYALGDLIATPQLAHVGFAEAMMVVKDILGEDPSPIDYGKVPWAIYCHPEVAFAGMTEQEARDAGFDVAVAKHRFTGNSRAMIVNETDGMVKIIAERDADGKAGRILGVHMMGPWVTEQLGQGYLAVNWEATVEEVASFIQPHPTLSELFGETMLDLTGRGLHG